MIQVRCLEKIFRVHKKQEGLKGSLKSLFFRQWVMKEALRKVSLSIGPNEIVGLVGANGAGKTTLVKILSGIIHPTSGEATVLGHTPWQRDNNFRRQISLIMGQKASLWWDLPAADCFMLLREIYQIPQDQFKKTRDELIQVLGVADQLNIPIRRLSLGERMKMELMAALLHRPKVIFLDEPTIGLDLTAQKNIREFLLHYQSEYRPSMILTSHYMEDISQLCKRIIIIKEGSFIYDGPLQSISTRFSQHKIISVHVEKSDHDLSLFPIGLGEIIYQNESQLKVKVKRSQVSEAASLLLQKFKVVDLTIEEVDIAEIIESLMKEGLHSFSQEATGNAGRE